jgi:hypothetical protein
MVVVVGSLCVRRKRRNEGRVRREWWYEGGKARVCSGSYED